MKRKKDFTKRATHRRPHPDECLADMFLTNFGDEKFPGISIVPIEYWKWISYDLSSEDFENDGCLLLGVGGGRFDEHRYDGQEGRKGCCASLVAEDLEIQNRPELIEALRYVTDNDTKGKTRPFDIASILRAVHGSYPTDSSVGVKWTRQGFSAHIKRMLVNLNGEKKINDQIESISSPKSLVTGWLDRKFGKQPTAQDDPVLKYILLYAQRRTNLENPFLFDLSSIARDLYYQHPNDFQIAENWIDLGLNAEYRERKQFITVTKEEFDAKTTIEKVRVGEQKLKVATIISDDELVAKYARSKEGDPEIALVIQIKPADKAAGDGFIQIHPNPKFGLSLDGITLAVRQAEQIAQGVKNPITDEKLLMAEGTLRKAPHWFRHVNDIGLYNGALSLTTDASLLEREIQERVRKGLQERNPAKPRKIFVPPRIDRPTLQLLDSLF